MKKLKDLDHSAKVGFSFGLTSGIITTLGLIVGLWAGTSSKAVVIGGILTIAIADAFSDASGIHISEESENTHSDKEVWRSTIATFTAKFVASIAFLLPIVALPLDVAISASVAFGMVLLAMFSYVIAKEQKKRCWSTIIEHVGIALLVIVITNFVGSLISSYFT